MKGRFAKASFALAIALVVSVAPARATTSVTFDGVWWQELSHGEKLAALQGIMAGIRSGFSAGWGPGSSYVIFHYVTSTQERKAIIYKSIENGLQEVDAMRAAEPVFSKTFGTYVEEISVWYEVHPKRTSILPSQLLEECFADTPPIASCDNLGGDLDK